MKTLLFILLLPLAALLPGKELKAQIFDIKPWSGTYPDMQGTYPLSFMAFKGWLIPVPHVFILAWASYQRSFNTGQIEKFAFYYTLYD